MLLIKAEVVISPMPVGVQTIDTYACPLALAVFHSNGVRQIVFFVNDSNDKNKSPSSAPSLYLFTIVLNETDNPLYDKNDIFYIKNENT